MKTLEEEWGWVAGFIDGEGCFCISQKQDGSLVPSLSVGNTSNRALQRLQALLGGKIYDKSPALRNRKKAWVWLAGPKDLRIFLRQLSTFLFVKKKQSQLMLEFLEINAAKYHKLPSRLQKVRRGLMTSMKELNHAGADRCPAYQSD
jgi:hypothetical protein